MTPPAEEKAQAGGADRLWHYLRTHPFSLAALLVCILSFSFFGELVDEVLEGDSHEWDEKILLMMRDPLNSTQPWGPRWLHEMMRDFTAMGGIGMLTLITGAAAFYLFIASKRGHAFYLLAAVITGTLLSNLMKIGFDRPRPDLVPHDSITYMAGFPSGHSFMATVVYLTLGSLLAEISNRTMLKIYFLCLAIFISLLVGISRIYLGVHWPSDVLAGWLIGTAWALLIWLIARFLQEKHILRTNAPVATTPAYDQ